MECNGALKSLLNNQPPFRVEALVLQCTDAHILFSLVLGLLLVCRTNRVDFVRLFASSVVVLLQLLFYTNHLFPYWIITVVR